MVAKKKTKEQAPVVNRGPSRYADIKGKQIHEIDADRVYQWDTSERVLLEKIVLTLKDEVMAPQYKETLKERVAALGGRVTDLEGLTPSKGGFLRESDVIPKEGKAFRMDLDHALDYRWDVGERCRLHARLEMTREHVLKLLDNIQNLNNSVEALERRDKDLKHEVGVLADNLPTKDAIGKLALRVTKLEGLAPWEKIEGQSTLLTKTLARLHLLERQDFAEQTKALRKQCVHLGVRLRQLEENRKVQCVRTPSGDDETTWAEVQEQAKGRLGDAPKEEAPGAKLLFGGFVDLQKRVSDLEEANRRGTMIPAPLPDTPHPLGHPHRFGPSYAKPVGNPFEIDVPERAFEPPPLKPAPREGFEKDIFLLRMGTGDAWNDSIDRLVLLEEKTRDILLPTGGTLSAEVKQLAHDMAHLMGCRFSKQNPAVPPGDPTVVPDGWERDEHGNLVPVKRSVS